MAWSLRLLPCRTRLLFAVSVVVSLSACASCMSAESSREPTQQQPSLKYLVQALSNDQVEWDGNPVGYAAFLRGDAPRQIQEQGEAAVPALIEALDDPDRFVVAHVLLTDLTSVRYRAFPDWNGLVIEGLGRRQPVSIDPKQRFTLARRWRQWAATQPRPKMLPEVD